MMVARRGWAQKTRKADSVTMYKKCFCFWFTSIITFVSQNM